MAWLAVFLVVLLAGQAQAAAKCQCALPIKKVQSTSSIKFILVGGELCSSVPREICGEVPVHDLGVCADSISQSSVQASEGLKTTWWC